MNNSNLNNTQPNPVSNVSSLPPPLNWIANFIEKYYVSMPKYIQVIVFLAFVACFIFTAVRLLWPLMFPKDYVEIHGEITGLSNASLQDSFSQIDFVGEGLYVLKKPIGDRFTYDWILRVPKTKMKEKLRLAFTKFNQNQGKSSFICDVTFYPDTLLKQSQSDKVHFEVDFKNPIPNITIAANMNGIVSGANREHPLYTSQSAITEMFLASAFAQTLADSIHNKLKQYIQAQNPVAQLDIRENFIAADTSVMLVLADSLKTVMHAGRHSEAADYALLLSDADSLSLLRSTERYNTLFDSLFYSEAVALFHADDEFESRNMALLLHKLQDTRLLEHVFREFLNTDSLRAKQLCLFVLEGYINSINMWLKETQQDTLWMPAVKKLAEALREEGKDSLATGFENALKGGVR